MFAESSAGRWAVLQLLCWPSKQGELSENMLQNLWNKFSLISLPEVESKNNFSEHGRLRGGVRARVALARPAVHLRLREGRWIRPSSLVYSVDRVDVALEMDQWAALFNFLC